MEIKKERDRILRKIWKQTADFFFPMGTYCICCGKYIDHTRTYALCDHCIRHIRWGQIEINLDAEGKHWKRPAYLDSASACAFYGLYSRRLIFELKYNGHTYVARSIAEILCDRVAGDPAAQRLLRADWVVPVPIHKSRRKQRGFNQTEKIGKHFICLLQDKTGKADGQAQGISLKLLADGLIRTRATSAQRALSEEERYLNMQGVFMVPEHNRKRLQGKNVILIYDVYTTGATANQCAQALKEAGASEVHLLALATGNDFAGGYFADEQD